MPVAVFGGASIDPYVDYNGFTLPNPGSTPYPWLSRWTETDHQIQDLGHLGQGILYGCQVRAFNPVAYKIRISSGQIILRGATASLAACEVPVNPPDGTLPRIDLAVLQILSSGAAHIQMVAGTPSNNPFPPLLPSGYLGVAFVFIPASSGAIYSNQIVSKRILVIPDEDITPRAVIAGNLGGGTVPAGSTRFGGIVAGGIGSNVTILEVECPFAGTVRNLYVRTGAQPAGGDLIVTLVKNGAATALTFTVAAGALAGTYSDTTNTVSVTAGSRLALSMENDDPANVSATLLAVGVEIDP